MYERMYRKMNDLDVDMVMCGRYGDTGGAEKEVFHGFPEDSYGKRELTEEINQQMIDGRGQIF